MPDVTSCRSGGDPEAVLLQRRLREAELTIQEREREISDLKTEITRIRETEAQRVSERARLQSDALYSEAASALAQLSLQAHVSGAAASELRAEDVLSVASRLVTAFRNAGVTVSADIGTTLPFDPGFHVAAGDASLRKGQLVLVRVPEVVTASGRVLSKAIVQPTED